MYASWLSRPVDRQRSGCTATAHFRALPIYDPEGEGRVRLVGADGSNAALEAPCPPHGGRRAHYYNSRKLDCIQTFLKIPLLFAVRLSRRVIVVAADVKTIDTADRIGKGVMPLDPRFAFASHVRTDFSDWITTLAQMNDARKMPLARDCHIVQREPTAATVSILHTAHPTLLFVKVIDTVSEDRILVHYPRG